MNSLNFNRYSKKQLKAEAVVRSCSVKKIFLNILPKFIGKHQCQSLFFNKVADLRSPTLFNRCFPVSFAKFLRVSIFIEHLPWLLL